jgi:hypothetical protein
MRLQFSAFARCGLVLSVGACGGRVGGGDVPDAAVGAGFDASGAALSDADVSPPRPLDAGALPPLSVDASVDAGVPLRYATIYGETLVAGGASLATAEFSSIVGTPPVCTLSTPHGSCAVATCGYAAADPSENAGPILVSDGTLSATLAYSAASPASYDTWQGSTAGWAAPSTLTFTAPPSDALAGGLMQTLPFPAATTLVTPNLTTMAAIDTSAPLPLAWSPTVASEVVFVIEAVLARDARQYAFLACVFDGNAGGAQIPRSSLLDLKTTATGSTDVRAGFLTVTRKLDVEQGWAIELAAFGTGGAYGPVTLD